jgi:ribonuclease T2
MDIYWKDYQGNDETFWEHEWSKHGTCISTLDTVCYAGYVPQQEVVDFFDITTNIFKTLPTYMTLAAAGVIPVIGTTYTAAQIQTPLQATHGASVTLRCQNGALKEVWYHFDVRGSVQTGQFVAAEPTGVTGNCPATGIKYLPKSGSTEPSGSSTTTMTTTGNYVPSPTGTPFEGKGFLEVSCHGKSIGCLISDGTWYISGTCAGFRAQADIVEADEEAYFFTLTSSRGPCGIIEGRFQCGEHLKARSIFSKTKDAKLSYQNKTAFYAAKVPDKFERVFVHNDKDEDHDLELEVFWSLAK